MCICLHSVHGQNKCSSERQACTGKRHCLNCGRNCKSNFCETLKFRRSCFSCENARSLSAQLSCPFVCAPPKPPPCVPNDCNANPVAAQYVSYDVNDDCKITVADANAIINHIAANPELGARSAEYDANGDRRVTALDALNVINYVGRNQCEQSCVPKDCDGNPVAAPYVSYDVNDDCKITVADANAIINHIAANPELGARSAEYDANGDGRVTARDALNITNYIGRNQCEQSCVPVNCFGKQVSENQVAYDTNQDCKITSADASAVRAHIDGNPDVKNRDAQYDANGDGIIDEKDAAVIDGYLVQVLCMELPTPTPTPTPTSTPIPSGACLTDGDNTRLTANNRLEYYYDSKKPGIWRAETALTGQSWPNGGTRKGYGTAASKLDWNLCPNIGFYERGHSLTRTFNFINPQEDGEYTLVVHRVRNKNESFGVSIRYWFDGSKVSFSGGAIRDRDNWRFDFNLHQDYNFTCSDKQDRNIPWRCSIRTTKLSAIACNRWHHSKIRNGCREIDVQ